MKIPEKRNPPTRRRRANMRLPQAQTMALLVVNRFGVFPRRHLTTTTYHYRLLSPLILASLGSQFAKTSIFFF